MHPKRDTVPVCPAHMYDVVSISSCLFSRSIVRRVSRFTPLGCLTYKMSCPEIVFQIIGF
jgi:hypothetical protein